MPQLSGKNILNRNGSNKEIIIIIIIISEIHNYKVTSEIVYVSQFLFVLVLVFIGCFVFRKAMTQSTDLHSNGDLQSMNQIVRWINTKEEHCSKIISAIGEYCLCQRVKKDAFASDKDYTDALKAHHAVMQSAMKAKQTCDPSACDALDHSLVDFAKMYTKEE